MFPRTKMPGHVLPGHIFPGQVGLHRFFSVCDRLGPSLVPLTNLTLKIWAQSRCLHTSSRLDILDWTLYHNYIQIVKNFNGTVMEIQTVHVPNWMNECSIRWSYLSVWFLPELLDKYLMTSLLRRNLGNLADWLVPGEWAGGRKDRAGAGLWDLWHGWGQKWSSGFSIRLSVCLFSIVLTDWDQAGLFSAVAC